MCMCVCVLGAPSGLPTGSHQLDQQGTSLVVLVKTLCSSWGSVSIWRLEILMLNRQSKKKKSRLVRLRGGWRLVQAGVRPWAVCGH